MGFDFDQVDDFWSNEGQAQSSGLNCGSLHTTDDRPSWPITGLPHPTDIPSLKFEPSEDKDAVEPVLHVERNPNPPHMEFEVNIEGEDTELNLHVKRNSNPPPLEFELDESTDGIALSGGVTRQYDHYIQGLPPSPYSFGKLPKTPLKPKVPDVSQGLGRRQARKDIVSLAKYVATILTLMVYRDELYVFEPPCWRLLKKRDACTKILEVLDSDDVNGCLVDSDAMTIYRRLLIESALQHPQELEPPNETINFRDGTYCFANFEIAVSWFSLWESCCLRRRWLRGPPSHSGTSPKGGGKGDLLFPNLVEYYNILEHNFYAHRPEDEFTYFVDVAWTDVCSSTEGKTFETFVASSGDGNPLVRQQLLELVALALTGMQLKYFYVILGRSHTGKTQFGRFLEELVGRANVGSISGIEDLGTQWTGGEIADCRLVTCLDLSNKVIPEAALTELKRLVGDDSVKGQKKYKDSITYYRKPLVVFAGNYPLRIPRIEKEEAFLNRMVVIPFSNPQNEETMIHHLYKELLQEAPYIIHEAIDAFEALAARNYRVTRSEIPEEFQPEDGRRAARDITKFIQTCCEFSTEQETSSADLWDAYCLYREGHDSVIHSQIDFSRNLAQALEGVELVSPMKRVNGTEARGYRGIILKPF